MVAAALGAKLSCVLRRELDVQFDCVDLWTDAVVVLRCICNTSTRFEVFVANRIELLLTLVLLSNENMCRAQTDLALSDLSPRKLESADMWFNGPAFFRGPEQEWRDQPKFVAELSAQEPDVKIFKKICCTTKTLYSKSTLLRLFVRYSYLATLQRVAAWIFRFVACLKWNCCNNADQPMVEPLSSEELEFACLCEHHNGCPATCVLEGAH